MPGNPTRGATLEQHLLDNASRLVIQSQGIEGSHTTSEPDVPIRACVTTSGITDSTSLCNKGMPSNDWSTVDKGTDTSRHRPRATSISARPRRNYTAQGGSDGKGTMWSGEAGGLGEHSR